MAITRTLFGSQRQYFFAKSAVVEFHEVDGEHHRIKPEPFHHLEADFVVCAE